MSASIEGAQSPLGPGSRAKRSLSRGPWHGSAFARVRAIGLSGQMHGAVLLDGDDRPVRPGILWSDGRSSAELGVLAMPGFTGPKILRLGRHEPDAIGRTHHIPLPKDTVRLKLTGEAELNAT